MINTHIVSCAAIIYNDKNEILLINNPKRGWEFPGGRLEPGETLYEALHREVKEETGANIVVEYLANINSVVNTFIGSNGTEVPTQVIFDFVCHYKNGTLSTSEESKEVKWIKKDEAKEKMSFDIERDRFISAEKYNGQVIYRVFEVKPYKLISENLINDEENNI